MSTQSYSSPHVKVGRRPLAQTLRPRRPRPSKGQPWQTEKNLTLQRMSPELRIAEPSLVGLADSLAVSTVAKYIYSLPHVRRPSEHIPESPFEVAHCQRLLPQ